jgi:PIN domain nuclease of toxin-antitoxin system
VWLAQGNLKPITSTAVRALEQNNLLISPMVLIELEYLFEIHRIKLPSRDILLKLEHELCVHVCDLPFPRVAEVVLQEKWTRDPFDRIIVAQAKANGLSSLISSDEEITKNYPRTIW